MREGDVVQQGVPVLVAASPGLMRDSLRAFLQAVPGVSVVGQADTEASVSRMLAAYCPVLVLLDTNLPGGEALAVLRQIKAQKPQCRCLVLADDRGQQQKALSAGADVALLKGFSASRLFEIVETLVDNHKTAAEQN